MAWKPKGSVFKLFKKTDEKKTGEEKTDEAEAIISGSLPAKGHPWTKGRMDLGESEETIGTSSGSIGEEPAVAEEQPAQQHPLVCARGAGISEGQHELPLQKKEEKKKGDDADSKSPSPKKGCPGATMRRV